MKQRQKILYWTPLFWPDIGGIEVLSMSILPRIQQRGYECIVVTSHGTHDLPDEMQYQGIPVYRFPFWQALGKNNLGQVINIRKQVAALKRTFKPDVVHLHFLAYIAYFHLATSAVHPTPTLLTVHSDLYGMRGDSGTLLGQTLRAATWVTGVSEATLSDTVQVAPAVRNRSSLVYNGLDAPTLPPSALPFDAPLLLCLGRLVHEKGFDVALAAFASLRQCLPQARLLIAGDGPLRADLEQQATELGLRRAVEFTGWIPPEKVPELMNTATLVVVPSRYREPFGLVALEAAQMARPVVATRLGGLQEVVVHQQTGLLVEKEDSVALAEAIKFLLEHPNTAIQMGQAGRARVLEVFRLEACVDAYDKLYRKLMWEAE